MWFALLTVAKWLEKFQFIHWDYGLRFSHFGYLYDCNRYLWSYFKNSELPAVKNNIYNGVFSCFKKSILKLFYNSHFSVKRTFTFQFLPSCTMYHPFFKKEQFFIVGWGSLLMFQVYVVPTGDTERLRNSSSFLLPPFPTTLLPKFQNLDDHIEVKFLLSCYEC